jgi:hypothetical protein
MPNLACPRKKRARPLAHDDTVQEQPRTRSEWALARKTGDASTIEARAHRDQRVEKRRRTAPPGSPESWGSGSGSETEVIDPEVVWGTPEVGPAEPMEGVFDGPFGLGDPGGEADASQDWVYRAPSRRESVGGLEEAFIDAEQASEEELVAFMTRAGAGWMYGQAPLLSGIVRLS